MFYLFIFLLYFVRKGFLQDRYSYLSFLYFLSFFKVPLPGSKSRWFDVETYEMKLGGGTIYADAPLEKIPVFQRGGSIIPKRERARRSSTQMKWDPYTLVVALDIQGRAQVIFFKLSFFQSLISLLTYFFTSCFYLLFY